MSFSAASTDKSKALADFAGVFTSPLRMAIIERLLEGPCIVGQLCESVGAGQAAVSKQLGLLKDCGLLRCRPDGRCREYSLAAPAIMGDILCLMRTAAEQAQGRCADGEEGTRA